ncbi:unnamed protein product [Rangifer tarandus platyrhynchus]|uniref:Uncharacterized protein n=1 Tax=Rangifer tarandus platyrhynchus TaxID=3082113 RepID=A0AC59ZZU7_RANTA
MFKLRPSGALRGDESGERSPFCLAPRSHAAFQHPCSNYTPGRPETPGEGTFPTSGTRRNTDHDDGDPPDVRRKWPSSAGEDRAMLLGFAMMGFSVLMFFVLGVTVLKPFLVSTQREESNCTIILVHIMDDWIWTAEINSKCFYTPKCHRDRNNLLSGALDIKEFFDHKYGTPFSCFYSPDSQSEDVILIKSTTRW